MGINFRNNFNGGINGADYKTGEQSLASGDLWDSYSVGVGGTMKYSSAGAANGPLGLAMTTTAATVAMYIEKEVPTSDFYEARFHFGFLTLPGVAGSVSSRTHIGRFRTDITTIATVCSPMVDENNHIAFYNTNGTYIATSAGTYALLATVSYRLEAGVNGVTGTLDWRLYRQDTGALVDSKSIVDQLFGGRPIGKIRVGRVVGSSFIGTIYFDDVVFSTTPNVGPVPQINAGLDKINLEPGVPFVLTATSTSGSVAWTQTAGPTVALTGTGALSRSGVTPAKFDFSALVFRATSVDAHDEISLSVLPATSSILMASAPGGQIPAVFETLSNLGTSIPVSMIYPQDEGFVTGAVTMSVNVKASLNATAVEFETGRVERGGYPATKSGDTWTSTDPWESKMTRDELSEVFNDYRCSIRAKVTTPTGIVYSPYVYVITRNLVITDAITPVWNPAHAWSANFTGTLSTFLSSFSSVYGEGATTMVSDPTHGNVAFVSLPNDYNRQDQPNPTASSVRFQAASRVELGHGSLAYYGMAIKPGTNFPIMYSANDPSDPDYPDPNGTGFVALAQFYGAPYNTGPGFALTSRMENTDDRKDHLRIIGNALNPGDPLNLINIPVRRNVWTDFVFGVGASTDIMKGWVEIWVRESGDGVGSPLRQLTLLGKKRLPRVMLQVLSKPNSFHAQIYERIDETPLVDVKFAKLAIGPTAASVDPHSY